MDARHEGAAAKVDHLGRGADERLRAAARADVGDPASADRDSLGGPVPGGGEDPALAEHGVGGTCGAGECRRLAGQRRAGGERHAVPNEAPA